MNEHLDDILYPPLEPYDTGMLIAGEGHRIAYEQSGNPEGKPVVFLHGGPGAGTSPWHRRFFDPERYRIILLDQRGCGRSTPHASEPDADLRHNTTWHLVADIELLRKNLGIEKWQVFGGSWGSALALAYAESHPQAVTEIVLRGIFTLRRHELEWFYEGGAASIVPDLWEDFIAPIPILERSQLMEAYHRRLADPDPAVHVPAAVAWSRWEAANLTLLPDAELIEAMTEPKAAVAFARIENHYFLHGGWFEPQQLIANVGRIRDIPAVIVQGRYDVCTPAMTAWDLHRAWPEADFVMIPDAAHAASEPGIASALRAATDRFAHAPVEKPDAVEATGKPESEAEVEEPDAVEATGNPESGGEPEAHGGPEAHEEPEGAETAEEPDACEEPEDAEAAEEPDAGEEPEESQGLAEPAPDAGEEPEGTLDEAGAHAERHDEPAPDRPDEPEADLDLDDPTDPEDPPAAGPELRRERNGKRSKKHRDTADL